MRHQHLIWVGTLTVFAVISAGCQDTNTAIVVDFEIIGDVSSQADWLDVSLHCSGSEGDQLRDPPYDLTRLTDDVSPSLAIEPSGAADGCELLLQAQVLGEDLESGNVRPLAANGMTLSYSEGAINRVSLELDLTSCIDLDGDGASVGGGCAADLPADCDELDSELHPGAVEECDDIDNNCNGVIDDLAPWGDVGCADDGTALLVDFELSGARASEITEVEAGVWCTGDEDITIHTTSLEADGSVPTMVLHPRDDSEGCVLLAQAFGAAEGESALRWVISSSGLELDFTLGEVAQATVVLDTEACIDLDGDGAAVGPSSEEGCSDELLECDDLDPSVRVGAPEQCNNRDDDCDGEVDEAPYGDAGCDSSDTFVTATFAISGLAAPLVQSVEVGVRCLPDGEQTRLTLDVEDFPDGVDPTVTFHGHEDGCEYELLAQGWAPSELWPMTSTSARYSFIANTVQLIELELDTGACTDADGDMYSAGPVAGRERCPQLDCDDLSAVTHSGAPEICDDRDNDCNSEIDDLSDADILAACGTWNPLYGLCTVDGVKPQCNGGELDCPGWLTSGVDDCDLTLDTNCDGGITGCGCDDIDLITCPDCHEKSCVGDVDVVCEPRWPEPIGFDVDRPEGDLPEELPCVTRSDRCPGLVQCGGTELTCVATPTVEICNDSDLLNEDCSSGANEADVNCEVFQDLSITCGQLELRTVNSGAYGECGVDHSGYHLCGAFDWHEGETGSPEPIRIRLHDLADFRVTVVEHNCCACTMSVSASDGYPVIEINSAAGPLFVTTEGQLSLTLDLHYPASGETLAIYRGYTFDLAIEEVDNSVGDDGTIGLSNPGICAAHCPPPDAGTR